ncbi:MAG: HEAT repeat domain-containing protein [Alphaproteobacteria bacterium]
MKMNFKFLFVVLFAILNNQVGAATAYDLPPPETARSKTFKSTLTLLKCSDPNKRMRAVRELRTIACDMKHPRAYEAAFFLTYAGDQNRKLAFECLRKMMMKGQDDETTGDAASFLLRCGTAVDRGQAISILHKKLSHPEIGVVCTAACTLGRLGGADQQKVIPIFHRLLSCPDALIAAYAARGLFLAGREYEKKALPVLRGLLGNPERIVVAIAANCLGQSDDPKDHELAFPALRIITEDPTDNNFLTAKLLLNSKIPNDKAVAYQVISAIAGDPSNPEAFKAARYLWGTGKNNDKVKVHLTLCAIARDVAHVDAFDAALLLWRSGNRENREIARSTFQMISNNIQHAKTFEAKHILDQATAMAHQPLRTRNSFSVNSALEEQKRSQEMRDFAARQLASRSGSKSGRG